MSSRRKILVTGADGFIGSHLAECLVNEGESVRAMVMYNAFGDRGRLDMADQGLVHRMEIFPADIRDRERVNEAVAGVTHIFHLASLIGIPYSYHAAESYVDTNVKGTLNLLQAARAEKIRQFIHTSTSEVYGSAQSVPMNEAHPLSAQSPYAASKIAADQMLTAFGLSHALPVTTVRPFNTYGPRQSARAVIPTIIAQIASGKTEIQLGATDPKRDLTYVDDIVNGFVATLDNQAALGETINLGSSTEISIGELADQIAKLMNVSISIASDKARVRPEASEVDRLLADCSKGKKLLGWEPKLSLTEGLTRTIEFFADQENLKHYHPDRYEI